MRPTRRRAVPRERLSAAARSIVVLRRPNCEPVRLPCQPQRAMAPAARRCPAPCGQSFCGRGGASRLKTPEGICQDERAAPLVLTFGLRPRGRIGTGTLGELGPLGRSSDSPRLQARRGPHRSGARWGERHGPIPWSRRQSGTGLASPSREPCRLTGAVLTRWCRPRSRNRSWKRKARL